MNIAELTETMNKCGFSIVATDKQFDIGDIIPYTEAEDGYESGPARILSIPTEDEKATYIAAAGNSWIKSLGWCEESHPYLYKVIFD